MKPVSYDDFAHAMDMVLEQKAEREAAISITSGSYGALKQKYFDYYTTGGAG